MKKSFLFLTLLACFLNLSSFASENRQSHAKFSVAEQISTDVHLGDFFIGTQLYYVWGDPVTGEISRITTLYSTGDVHWFYGYLHRAHIDHPWSILIDLKETSTSPTLTFYGELAYH